MSDSKEAEENCWRTLTHWALCLKSAQSSAPSGQTQDAKKDGRQTPSI